MIKIKAKFIGTSSEGYVKNMVYTIKVHPGLNTIHRADGTGQVVYQSIHAFLSNWTNIVREV